MTTRTRTAATTISARFAFSLTLALLLALAGAGGAVQAAQAKRLGVVTFRGPGEGATRNAVSKVAKANHYQVVGGQQIAKAASKLKVSLDTNDSFQAVAKELGIAAFVTGEVSKKKATLTVRNGADGSVTAEASWTGPNPRKLSAAVNKTFWRRLGAAIERAKAPSGAKQAAVAEEAAAPETGADEGEGAGGGGTKKATEATADEGTKDSGRKPSSKAATEESRSETAVSATAEHEESGAGAPLEALVISAGPRVLSRSLSYTDNVLSQNRNYKLAAAPEIALNLDVFPAAFSRAGFISNIGLTGSLGYMLPVVTTPATSGSGTYKTYALDWSIGLKVRIPMGIYATVGYGDQRYQLVRPTGVTTDIVPMVDYRYVRGGVGARIPVGQRFTVMANLAYLKALTFGQIANTDYFPHTTGAAAEAGAAVGYRLSSLLEVQAGGDIRRFGLAFNITKADTVSNPNTRLAGGAVDQYLMGWVGLAVILGGEKTGAGASSGGAHGEDEEAAPAKAGDEDKDKDKGGDKDEDKDDK